MHFLYESKLWDEWIKDCWTNCANLWRLNQKNHSSFRKVMFETWSYFWKLTVKMKIMKMWALNIQWKGLMQVNEVTRGVIRSQDGAAGDPEWSGSFCRRWMKPAEEWRETVRRFCCVLRACNSSINQQIFAWEPVKSSALTGKTTNKPPKTRVEARKIGLNPGELVQRCWLIASRWRVPSPGLRHFTCCVCVQVLRTPRTVQRTPTGRRCQRVTGAIKFPGCNLARGRRRRAPCRWRSDKT